MGNVWWKEPMRVLQYNLQVRDTPGMDAEKIARETEEMAANVVVMNVGGIYAWYRVRLVIINVNEFLPEGRVCRNGLMRFIKGILNSWPGLTSVLRMIPHISKKLMVCKA